MEIGFTMDIETSIKHENGSLSKKRETIKRYCATVAICTYRRYDFLKRLIPKAARLSTAHGALELLIVDNTDDDALVGEFYREQKLPAHARLLRSFPPGLSRARNLALKEAMGDYVLFLDDDAEPSEAWAHEIVETFLTYPDAAVVGGPILPIWPGARPHWLSAKYEGCLTILDGGGQFRKLEKHEHAYGANIAVHKLRMFEVGGFPEHLGRKKTSHLLSNEEIAIQNDLRGLGHTVYYNPNALVFHHAHPDRVNQSWIRRRMAWQAVSDAMLWESNPRAVDLLARALPSAAKLGLDPSIFNIFTEAKSSDDMDAQVGFIMSLMEACLLSDAQISDEQRATLTLGLAHHKASTARSHVPRSEKIAAPTGLSSRGFLFIEATPGHEYLFDAYCAIPGSKLFVRDFDPWRGDDIGIDLLTEFFLEAALAARSQDGVLVLLTMDYFARPNVSDIIARIILETGVNVVAFLHRFPSEPAWARSTRELADVIQKVVVFSKQFKDDLCDRFGIANVEVLPHHAPTACFPQNTKAAARERLNIPRERHVVSLIGEMREGKGEGLVLDALKSLQAQTKSLAYFLFAGKATSEMLAKVNGALRGAEVLGRGDFRETNDRRVFALINELDYGDYVAATDTGLLIYQGSQRGAVSGVLPCYVSMGAGIIATSESFVGKLCSEYGLADLLFDETPEELAKAIDNAVQKRFRRSHEGVAAYLSSVELEAVNDRLLNILKASRPG